MSAVMSDDLAGNFQLSIAAEWINLPLKNGVRHNAKDDLCGRVDRRALHQMPADDMACTI